MENATKALLIAAGVLIAVMILAMLVMFGSEIASYFTEKHESAVLQQLVEFNNKFVNYNGQTIRGNELISIMNRVIDYNNYQAGMVGYDRIRIEIDLKGYQDDFTYNGETGGNRLIQNDPITNNASDDMIKRIAETSTRLTTTEAIILGITDTQLQKLSSKIEYIVNEPNNSSDYSSLQAFYDAKEAYETDRGQKLYNILRTNTYDIEAVKRATYQYYQFTKFKQAIFKCTNVILNTENGRVNRMTFEVEEKNGSIKFE